MSHRLTDASPLPSADSATRVGSNGDARSALDWEALFPTIPPDQQQTLLALVLKQAFRQARHVPTANGTLDRAGQFFSALLAGQAAALEPFVPALLQPVDRELDETQLAAVARALCTPDVYLIAGLPGTGKSRVIAELI